MSSVKALVWEMFDHMMRQDDVEGTVVEGQYRRIDQLEEKGLSSSLSPVLHVHGSNAILASRKVTTDSPIPAANVEQVHPRHRTPEVCLDDGVDHQRFRQAIELVYGVGSAESPEHFVNQWIFA